MDRPLEYRSFLFTAWQEQRQDAEGDFVWRFGLEDARSDNRRRVFATLEEVMGYVEKALTEKGAECEVAEKEALEEVLEEETLEEYM